MDLELCLHSCIFGDIIKIVFFELNVTMLTRISMSIASNSEQHSFLMFIRTNRQSHTLVLGGVLIFYSM